ncbi:2,3-butanediol dehydrogenase [Solirubrobacter soli]|uniref:2,3-butanediol dehydrogenase n=1 Tax=Solirubrobacter soli TaxID=363832 RepID=UPI0003F4D433|nr:2,3-butanediol dehydrogenase [Solirubrobacter soli]
MRAVRFHGRRDIRVEDVPDPPAPHGHEILVQPRWCGICGTDLHEYVAGPIVTPVEPHPLTGAQNPQILGHEFSADVLAIGEDVRTVAVGDRVAIMPLAYCGQCYFCVRGLNHLCEKMGCVGLSWAWGGLGEQAIVLEYQAAVIPESLSYEQGALIEPAAVAMYGVERGKVGPGDTVLVTGGGPIGALAVLCAKAAGAAAVYLSEPNAQRRAHAEKLAPSDILDPTAQDIVQTLRARTGGVGVDVAIECAGNGRALSDCVRATRRAGVVVQTGLHVGTTEVDPMLWSLNDLTIEGTWCYKVYDWPRIAALIANGDLPVQDVITARVEAGDVVSGGFDVLADPQGAEVKVLVAVGS